jgi:SAM-dependent methyltransferase
VRTDVTDHSKHAGVAEPEGGWRTHMHFDVESRRNKARKIIALIEQAKPLTGCRALEIGTGTGVISAEVARAVGPTGQTVSIDTMDTRVDSDGYTFQLTSGVRLPFDDASFDVVISNHVVEHVGTRSDQAGHLSEIRRILRPGGVGYVATPTRWALVEPHFKVPMLSWPPRRLRNGYVRLARKGKNYDVDPYGPREIRRAFTAAGLHWEDKTLDAVEELIRVERPTGPARVLALLPAWLLRLLRPALPTMIYLVRPVS